MDIAMFQRLDVKTMEHAFVNTVMEDYNVCPKAANLLVQDAIEFAQTLYHDHLPNGQIIRYVVKKGESAGKPIKDCKRIPVKLTLRCNEDLIVFKAQGTPILRRALVCRLAWEAYEQDGVLTQEDLADLLYTTRRTIQNIISDLKKEGISIPTRGNIDDIGRGVSHKTKCIELYINDFTFSDIMFRTGHCEESVNRYIQSFVRVALLHRQGFDVDKIRITAKMSDKLVREYLELYDAHYGLHEEKLNNMFIRFDKPKKKLTVGE